MNCVVFGNNSLTIECAANLLGHGHRILRIVASDKAVTRWAEQQGIGVVDRPSDLAAALAGEPVDLLLSVAYLSIIPRDILSLAKFAAVNFHDGPLPGYAGLNTPAWALLNGEKHHGITWHLMTGQVDEGDILLRRSFDIDSDETAFSLNVKCYQAAIDSFDELLELLNERPLHGQSQDLLNRRYFASNHRPDAAATLAWNQDADTLVRTGRALDFGDYENPLALPKLSFNNTFVIVGSIAADSTASAAEPGTIIRADKDELRISTSSSDVVLTRFSTPEGKPASLSSLLQSAGLRPGDRLSGISGKLAEHLTASNRKICRHERYWVDRLTRLVPVSVPYAKASAGSEKPSHGVLDMNVPAAFSAYARERGNGADGFGHVVTAFASYLSRIGGQAEFDLAFRGPHLKPVVQGLEGVFSSHVPLRFECAPADGFATVADRTIAVIEEAQRHVSFARDAILRHPALRTLVGSGPCAGLQVAVEVTPTLDDYFPLDGSFLTIVVPAAGERIRWRFDKSRLAAADVILMQKQFAVFLNSIAREPEKAILTLDILEQKQRATLLIDWNATETAYSKDECIHHVIEAQVARTPDQVALAFEDRQLTYRELDVRANQLANFLIAKGLRPDGFVGIYLPRSVDMIVAVLATLKAGGAYLPLDPDFPEDRIRFMLSDADASIILTSGYLAATFTAGDPRVVRLDADGDAIALHADSQPLTEVRASNLAYIIYTSGSTGTPKGVLVEHRNVVNFFTGMDSKIVHNQTGVWLAVTSLSFDISVLELLWTLARGFKVVLYSEATHRRTAAVHGADDSHVDLSLFYFAADENESAADKYRLLLEGARFADAHGFSAVWTPERHFDAFGGLYPNPSVTAAAIAAVTSRIGIRAGSCVLPLHSPIRVAEEWALVDNLSRGRVGISFASGWQPHDFVLKPETFADRQRLLFEQIEVVRRLWRGEAIPFKDGTGQQTAIRTLPRPIQPELPIWITAAGNPDTFKRAGEGGFNLLTHLLGQSIDELAAKLKIYRSSLKSDGRQSAAGHVTLMLHTFLGRDKDEIREIVREPMKSYLRSAVGLIEKAAWSFPTFRQTSNRGQFNLNELSDGEMEAVLDFAFERYFETSGLFGTPQECCAVLERLHDIGVDEVGCLIDFGVPTDDVLRHFTYLNDLREYRSPHLTSSPDYSVAGLVAAHGVTHLQCTPSMMTMLLADQRSRRALRSLRQVMIGGEMFPGRLADELKRVVSGEILNMYGPTETTIWSAVHSVNGEGDPIPIGKPISNTRFYVLDQRRQPVPVGVVGELFIGGDGVARGYHNRLELTADRFVPDSFSSNAADRLYRTGDLVRYRPDGNLQILGRSDQQVKIRGYRIELGEIEAALGRHSAIAESVVAVRDDLGGDRRLVAYLRVAGDSVPSTAAVRKFLAGSLPDYMIPSRFFRVETFALTPNQKIDRKALPPPESAIQLDTPTPGREEIASQRGDAVETMLRQIWMELLQLSSVGIDDNFFDLGGHSLLAVQVHRRIQRELKKDIVLTDLFKFPTIRSLARQIGRVQSDLDADLADAAARRVAARRRSVERRRSLVG